jgi:hypothetical protein
MLMVCTESYKALTQYEIYFILLLVTSARGSLFLRNRIYKQIIAF